jgi:hypothetical protein
MRQKMALLAVGNPLKWLATGEEFRRKFLESYAVASS